MTTEQLIEFLEQYPGYEVKVYIARQNKDRLLDVDLDIDRDGVGKVLTIDGSWIPPEIPDS